MGPNSTQTEALDQSGRPHDYSPVDKHSTLENAGKVVQFAYSLGREKSEKFPTNAEVVEEVEMDRKVDQDMENTQ